MQLSDHKLREIEYRVVVPHDETVAFQYFVSQGEIKVRVASKQSLEDLRTPTWVPLLTYEMTQPKK